MNLLHGDCLNELKAIASDSIDLVITSPPYTNRRVGCYKSITETKYIEWFLPIAREIKRVLKPTGSFFLNIKPHSVNGVRCLYVFDLVLSLKRVVGFKFIDEFCWTKNAFPGAMKGKFKNGFEPVYHFTKLPSNKIVFNPTACGTPMKKESIARTYRKQCGRPQNGSRMTGMNTTNIRNLKLARPSNVINANNVSNQFSDKSKHPATYPEKLVEFFIKSFTNEKMVVLDPFMGSGTTGIVCTRLNRDFIGIEIEKKYFNLAKGRIPCE